MKTKRYCDRFVSVGDDGRKVYHSAVKWIIREWVFPDSKDGMLEYHRSLVSRGLYIFARDLMSVMLVRFCGIPQHNTGHREYGVNSWGIPTVVDFRPCIVRG